MDYGTIKYASSTTSEPISDGCVQQRTNRIRTVRLVRPSHGLSYHPRHGPALGFSVRGGREHGTGIFVSQIEVGSEAHAAGLKIGDQIIRINGFCVDDAVHKEVLQLISNHARLVLKVRGVGMLPVKNKPSEVLSWQIVTADSDRDDKNDVWIQIAVPTKSKLGCGICKGPDWKPGIFVQFTKEGGAAREAGLRPGDQILRCNRSDFTDANVNFNEAVALMKSAKQLQLRVRKGAGADLFPGESSGYNSSASSVTGDSPASCRLSLVKEDQMDQFKKNFKKWDTAYWDEETKSDKPLFKPTIINLTENGLTTIQNNGSEYTYDAGAADPVYSVPQKRTGADKAHLTLTKSASASSVGSVASCSNSVASSSVSLSSAITMEIERRQKKLAKQSIEEQLSTQKSANKMPDKQQQWQHSKLMDEFKKAHRKMFKIDAANDATLPRCGQDRLNSDNELTQKLTKRLAEMETNVAAPPAPPPPPPPELNNNNNNNNNNSNTLKLKKIPPLPPVKYSVLSSPPPCPTPDYDTLSLASGSSPHSSLNKTNGQLETTRKTVSVTIGSYPSVRRDVVGKLDFLLVKNDSSGNATSGDRLTCELTQTLNRSNLKKRTESTEDLIEPQRNGTVRINLNK